jgi:hypothetical protein
VNGLDRNFKGMGTKPLIEDIYHIQSLNNYMKRWTFWLKCFNCIGTAYIESYLNWFRFMENNAEYADQKGGKRGVIK